MSRSTCIRSIESTHVLTLGLFVGLAVMLDLRLLGLTMRRVPVSEVHRAAAAVDEGRLRGDGHHRRAALLRHPRQDLSEHLLSGRRSRCCCLAGLNVWLFHSRVERRVADWDLGAGHASRGPCGRRRLARPLGGHRRRGPDDRLQLVRLRHSATVRLHQLGRRLRRPALDNRPPWTTSLLPLFEWCEATAIGHAIRIRSGCFRSSSPSTCSDSACWADRCSSSICGCWASGFAASPIAELAAEVRPWLLGSIGVMVVTGTALFLSESVKCYYNQAFWVKITTMPAGPALHADSPSARCAGGSRSRRRPGRRLVGDRVAGPVVHRRRRGTLDRVLVC